MLKRSWAAAAMAGVSFWGCDGGAGGASTDAFGVGPADGRVLQGATDGRVGQNSVLDAAVVAAPDAALVAERDAALVPNPDAAVVVLPDAAIVANLDAAVVVVADAAVVVVADAVIVANPDATVVANLDAVVVANPDAAITASPDAVIVANPDAVIVANPDAVVVANPDAVVVANPDAAIVANPDAALDAGPSGVVCEVVAAIAPPIEPTPWSADLCLFGDPGLTPPDEWPPPSVPPGNQFTSPPQVEDVSGFGDLLTTWWEWNWDPLGALYREARLERLAAADGPDSLVVNATLCRINAAGVPDLSGYQTSHTERIGLRWVPVWVDQSVAARIYDDLGRVVREMNLDTPMNERAMPIAHAGPWPTTDYVRDADGRIETILERSCRQEFPPTGAPTADCDDLSFTRYIYGADGRVIALETGTPAGTERRQIVGGPCP